LFEVIDTEDKLLLVMEFAAKGRVIEWIPEKHEFRPTGFVPVVSGYLDEDFTRKIVRDCVKALKHLHERGIMHRDIKP
jgi:serine/threonine protein kinase